MCTSTADWKVHSLQTDNVYWFGGPVVNLPSIYLMTMAAVPRWWI